MIKDARGGEMTENTDWYVAMGDAVREHKRALAMVENWQEKVAAAEARITELAAQTPRGPVTPEPEVQEQAQEQ